MVEKRPKLDESGEKKNRGCGSHGLTMLTAKNFIVGYLIASQTITSFREKNTDSAHIDTMARIVILETDISQRIKPSISSHSKSRMRSRMRRFKCFVLNALCSKTKHLRHFIRDLVQEFEWLEILGFTLVSSN